MTAQRSPALIWLGVTFAVIVLLMAAPLIAALSASVIASLLGCTVNEGGASPCPVAGVDIGGALVIMFVLGWLALVTLPLGGVVLAIWSIVACVIIVVRWRRRGQAI